jgi:AP-4 complex subunit mu-1
MFLSKVGITNSYQEDNLALCAPFFEMQGIQFVYIKKNQLYFVFTSKKREMMTAYMLELLIKVTNMIHDFCGGLEEEIMRRNFILIYELIDEMIDYGYP